MVGRVVETGLDAPTPLSSFFILLLLSDVVVVDVHVSLHVVVNVPDDVVVVVGQ